MLQRIWIKNFALIHELNLNFSAGYTAISGETGSGKSIFLGALNLILGERADFALIGPKGEKAIVEAEFKNIPTTKAWFEIHDIEQESTLIVRREISATGRSRAFVNDTPVSLIQLKELCTSLVSIHSQYDTLSLKDKFYHQEIFDLLSGSTETLSAWQKKYFEWKKSITQLEQLKKLNNSLLAEKDYIRFQLDELNLLNLDSVDVREVEEDLKSLENAEELQSLYGQLYETLGSEQGVNFQISTLRTKLDKSQQLHPSVQQFNERLNAVLVELKDIEVESENKLESIEKNPERLATVLNWMDQYQRILSKHRVGSKEDLMELKNNWQNALLDSDNNLELMNSLEISIEKERQILHELASKLHENRVKNAEEVEQKIEKLLAELNMKDFNVKFDFSKLENFTENGITKLDFLVRPNKGYGWQNIEKSASGGELSRLMLSLQYLISDKKLLPTVLFDEIDTGISGEVAQKMGILLKKMGENFQLIAISHLPQVVSKASHHLKVEKFNEGDITTSELRYLTENERVEEVARLMSGTEITAASLESAKTLMLP